MFFEGFLHLTASECVSVATAERPGLWFHPEHKNPRVKMLNVVIHYSAALFLDLSPPLLKGCSNEKEDARFHCVNL